MYLGTDRLSGWPSQRRWQAIGAAVLLATLTPFCSGGTTAIVLGMLATALRGRRLSRSWPLPR